MKGIIQLTENNVITMSPEASSKVTNQSLRESVRLSLKNYFAQLDGQPPANLYDLVLAEVEKPLIEMVLQLTAHNQSKTAKMLGLSRGTLRKKMAIYDLF